MFHNLRAVREASGWTLNELAELAEVSPQTIRSIESGEKVFFTHFTTADRLAWALDCEVSHIFRDGEISGTGRPAGTGKSLNRSSGLLEMTCWSCHLVVRKDEECNFCGANQTLMLVPPLSMAG